MLKWISVPKLNELTAGAAAGDIHVHDQSLDDVSEQKEPVKIDMIIPPSTDIGR